ncbi:DUF2285 domain-containing protein [Sphingomonas koreensis]|nr:DUF2285 domain-containing protein [Sphingomonas koreensis]
MSARARPRAASALRRFDGDYAFAEAPERAAPDARIIWDARLDPGTLSVAAVPTSGSDPDGIRVADLAPWLAVARDPDGREHAVLSDGWHRIRLEVDSGSLIDSGSVLLRYRIAGTLGAEPKILPLRRLLHLCRYRCFSRSLFPEDRHMARWVRALRVHDALVDGASQRDIAIGLFGEDRVTDAWYGESDSLRLRVRRLTGLARRLAQGGYRTLMKRSPSCDSDSDGESDGDR